MECAAFKAGENMAKINKDLVNNIDKHFGEFVHMQRTKMRLTQQQVADLADVARYTVLKIEKGEGNPCFSIALRILDALDSSLSDLSEFALKNPKENFNVICGGGLFRIIHAPSSCEPTRSGLFYQLQETNKQSKWETVYCFYNLKAVEMFLKDFKSPPRDDAI